MNAVLWVDDAHSLIGFISSWAQGQGLQDGNQFLTSLSDARKAVADSRFGRYVADHIFEGEEDSGLLFLQDVRAADPEAELVLLTGKAVDDTLEAQVRDIGATLMEKTHLDHAALKGLLGGLPLASPETMKAEEIDVGEVKLRLESMEFANAELRDELERIRRINDLLVEDILLELSQVKDQKRKLIIIGNGQFSAADLREEILNKTPLGRELIRLHHELFRRLRRSK